MNRASLRRVWLELAVEETFGIVLILYLQYTGIVVTFRPLLIIVFPGLTALFGFRLRLPGGRWTAALWFDLIGFWLLLLTQSVMLSLSPQFMARTVVIWFILFMVLITTLTYWTMRGLLRFWRFWNRLRQAHLAWALTHAHMMVALALVWFGYVIVVMGLSIIIAPSGEPIEQILLVIPFSIVIASPSVFLLLAVLALSAVFSYFVMRPTVRRLQHLVATTDQLSGGNYAARSLISGKDEVMHLQVNFNRMAAELERTVGDLRGERDAVQRLLQLRRELMTSVSHELRTPIATLRAYVETMLDAKDRRGDPLPDTLIRDLHIVTDEVIRLQTLVDDLFTLARTEIGQLPLHVAPTDVAAVAAHVVAAIAPLSWNSYRVQVVTDIAPNAPLARGDALRVEQILRNLIQNSLQHTPPGGIVTVEVGAERTGGVRLSVEDTGEGIAAADLPHIWERFYRGNDSRQARDGSGLGLALVKELAEAMGGSVEVQSTPREGSRFTVRWPCA